MRHQKNQRRPSGSRAAFASLRSSRKKYIGFYERFVNALYPVQRPVPPLPDCAEPDTKQRLVENGADVETMSVEQFQAFVNAESSKYLRVIKETGVTAE